MSTLNENDLKVIRGIRNVVAERGENWTYPKDEPANKDWFGPSGACVNLLPDGSPACIIGAIAVDQGLPTERGSSATYDAERWDVSPAVRSAMQLAQAHQDNGKKWGFALERFEDTLIAEGYTIPEEDVK